MIDDVKPGAEIEFGYPFVREPYSDADGGETMTWRPGCRDEQCAPDEFRRVADAIGSQIVTVVSVHKPGKYPARVFFTRRWRDPSGREFGKGGLHTKTLGNFRALVNGYRGRYEMSDTLPGPSQTVKAFAELSAI